jgi:hypothetical protein
MRGGMSEYYSLCLCVGVPPHALEVTGDLDKEERRVGGRGNDLGEGLRDAAAELTSVNVRTVFFPAFPLLS